MFSKKAVAAVAAVLLGTASLEASAFSLSDSNLERYFSIGALHCSHFEVEMPEIKLPGIKLKDDKVKIDLEEMVDEHHKHHRNDYKKKKDKDDDDDDDDKDKKHHKTHRKHHRTTIVF